MKRRYALIFLIILLGAIVGSAFGRLVGWVVPEGPVKTFFFKTVALGFNPFTIDLSVIQLTLGLMLRINILSIVGVMIMAYILKWII